MTLSVCRLFYSALELPFLWLVLHATAGVGVGMLRGLIP